MYGLFNCTSILLPEERNIVNNHLCRTCNTLALKYGYGTRIFANYDSTFISLLSYAQSNEGIKCYSEKMPKVKQNFSGNQITAIDKYAAAISVSMAYVKFRDDIFDENSPLKKVKFSCVRKKAELAFKDLLDLKFNYKLIDDGIKYQHYLENQKPNSIFDYTLPTERVVSQIFAHSSVISGQLSNFEYLEEIGKNIGRMMYILDCYADFDKDLSQKKFNPLIEIFNVNNADSDCKRNIKDLCGRILKDSLNKINRNFRKLFLIRYSNLIYKMLTDGLKQKISFVLNGRQNLISNILPITILLPVLQNSDECECCSQTQEVGQTPGGACILAIAGCLACVIICTMLKGAGESVCGAGSDY